MALALVTAAIVVLAILVAAAYLLPEPPEPGRSSGRGAAGGSGPATA